MPEIACGPDRILGRAFDKPKNFRLSFDLFITATSSAYINLLHFTTGPDNVRLPCVMIPPSSTLVGIQYATPDKWNKGWTSSEIGTQVWTSFVVTIEGKMMTVSCTGQGETSMMLDYEIPPMGAVLCYAGLTANMYANTGKVRNIRMVGI
jgi:hypothetical protein